MDQTLIGQTRRSLHVVAELVMAGPQYRESGTIRLVVTPSGFRTKAAPALAIEDEHLVTDGMRHALSGTTAAALASSVGVEPAAPNLYHDGTKAGPDEPIEVDPAVARWIVDALNVGAAALSIFAPDQEPVLWPEHFDVSSLVDDVSYGVSPGDGFIGEPYAYVAVAAPDDDPFWNQPFGAARTVAELGSADSVAEYFREGQSRLASAR